MKKLWNQFKEYMNIEIDQEVARIENAKALKIILLIGFLNSLLLVVMNLAVLGRVRYETVIGTILFLFFLAFSFINWPELKIGITIKMEIVISILMAPIAIVEYLPEAKQAAFLYLILIAVSGNDIHTQFVEFVICRNARAI